MEKREELYSGKAKSVYKTDDPDRFILTFRNDTSAFDGVKVEQLDPNQVQILKCGICKAMPGDTH